MTGQLYELVSGLWFMPEKGWYSLTVRSNTARIVKELAKARGLTVDELLNELVSPIKGNEWLTCSLCGARVKAANMTSHMAKMHPG